MGSGTDSASLKHEETMKYYKIRYAAKSHCDYPSPFSEDVFKAKDDAEKEAKVERITRGCEDWDVREITQELYNSFYDKEEYI